MINICEVGVGAFRNSNGIAIMGISNVSKVILIEPNPLFVEDLRNNIKSMPENEQKKIVIHQVAVWKTKEKVRMNFQADKPMDLSGFVDGLPNAPLINRYKESGRELKLNHFMVDAVTFDEIDDGNIDEIYIDIEGAEWFLLQKMKSRPEMIRVETDGVTYRNPFLKEIRQWMFENGYVFLGKDGSDSIWELNTHED